MEDYNDNMSDLSEEESSFGNQVDKIRKKGENAKRNTKKWKEENVINLIELLEERSCLWDIYDKEYTKRDKREVAYKEIAENLGNRWEISEIKTKINNLRAQLGREIGKVKKTKSGQATNELYKSSWVHWERLQFLVPQMQPSSTRDTISIPDSNTPELYVESETEEDIQPKSKRKRGSIKKKFEEKKLEILEGCSNMLAQSRYPSAEKSQSITSPFALYVDEKLKLLEKRTRMFTEKRIMDIIFEAEMGAPSNTPVRHDVTPYASHTPTNQASNNYWMNMLNLDNHQS